MFSKYISKLPGLTKRSSNISKYSSTIKITDIDNLQQKYLNLYQAQEKIRSDLLWCNVLTGTVIGCLMVITSNENRKNTILKNDLIKMQNQIDLIRENVVIRKGWHENV